MMQKYIDYATLYAIKFAQIATDASHQPQQVQMD